MAVASAGLDHVRTTFSRRVATGGMAEGVSSSACLGGYSSKSEDLGGDTFKTEHVFGFSERWRLDLRWRISETIRADYAEGTGVDSVKRASRRSIGGRTGRIAL